MAETTDQTKHVRTEVPDMFRPPVNRAMRVLDRSFFRKTFPISAATVFKNSEISKTRQELVKSNDLLVIPKLNSIREVKESDDVVRKCLLLREDIKHNGRSLLDVAWSFVANC